MKIIQVPTSRFDLAKFKKCILDFLRETADIEDAASMVAVVNAGVPVFLGQLESTPDPAVLVANGDTVFFYFTAPYLGDPIQCADGTSVDPKLFDPEYDDDEKSGERVGEHEQSLFARTVIGDSCYGFLVRSSRGIIEISSAILHPGACPFPSPEIEQVQDCGIFDDQMNQFAHKFIREQG